MSYCYLEKFTIISIIIIIFVVMDFLNELQEDPEYKK
jgi:hypothetical protein